MAVLFHNPRFRVTNSSGVPYNAARLFAYETGTTTPQSTYSNAALSSANTNPLVADAGGLFGPVYMDTTLVKYKFVCKTSVADGDITLWTIDPYENGVTGNIVVTGDARINGDFSIYDTAPRIFLSETDQGTNQQNWDVFLDAGVLSVRTRTDADGAGKNILVVTRGTTTAISSIAIGNATDLPTITLNGTALVASSISQLVSSNFTGTLTGMTASTTGTIYYTYSAGGLACLYTSISITGTSNTTAMTMTGIPAALVPNRTVRVPVALYDNGAAVGGWGTIVAGANSITFNLGFDYGTVFTNANSKGVNSGFTMIYPLT